MRLEFRAREVALGSPFVTARGPITSRTLILAQLYDEDGGVGYGEAAPLPAYDGVAVAEVLAALEDCRAALASGGPGPGGDVVDPEVRRGLVEACRQAAVLPQAVAAVDLALWDLAGRRAELPVHQLLGVSAPAPVEVNGTVSAPDRAGAVGRAARLQAAGFGCVKVKVGLGDDAGRVAAVRAVLGGETAIRLDANGSWSVQEAVAALEALAPAGIELCEEPASGPEANGAVAAATSVAVALDESARRPGALDQRHCTAVCLKVSACGGITGLLESASRARAVGYQVYLASTLDGPLGIAAALHAASAIAPDRPCGLATLELLGLSGPTAENGRMTVPEGPGLGSGLTDF